MKTRLILLSFLLSLVVSLDAATFTWKNVTGNWTNAANWEENGVPQSGDTVVIAHGNVMLTSNAEVAQVDLSGGTLTGSANLSVTSVMNWTGGKLAGGGIGSVVILQDAMLNISGNNTKALEWYIASSGMTTWSGAGNINAGNGARFDNFAPGVFDITGVATFSHNLGGGITRFINGGTVRKSTFAATSVIDVQFENTGTVDLQIGRLDFTRGGTSSGNWMVGSGTILGFGGGTHDITLGASESISGAGGFVSFYGGTTTIGGAGSYTPNRTSLDGGTVNFNLDATGSQWDFNSGTLGGSGTVSVNSGGSFFWYAGTMTGSGMTSIPGDGSMTVGTSAVKMLTQRTISNAGTVTINGSGDINCGSGARFENQLDALFDIQSNCSINHNQGGGVTVFDNAGTVRRSGFGSLSIIDATFNNTGLVESLVAQLAFEGDGMSTGDWVVTSPAVLAFRTGTRTITLGEGESISGTGSVYFQSGTTTIAGTGNYDVVATSFFGGTGVFDVPQSTSSSVNMSSGTLSGSGTFTCTGNMTWNSASMTGSGTTEIPVDATLFFTSGSAKALQGRTINNFGTATWSGSNLNCGDGCVINNHEGALFNSTSAGSMDHNLGGNPPVFNNFGTMQRSSISGSTFVNVEFNNDGLVELTTGNFFFGQGGTSTGDWQVGSNSTLAFDGGDHQISLAVDKSITGSGTVQFGSNPATISGLGAYDPATTRVQSGNVNFNLDVTTGSLILSGGDLGGSGNFTVLNSMSWTGGEMSDAGKTIIPMGATLTISGNFAHTLRRDLDNSGIATCTDFGGINCGEGAVFSNLVTGVFDVQGDMTFSDSLGGDPAVFVNEGTFVRSAGTGLCRLNMRFDSTTGAEVQTGRLEFFRGGTSGGNWLIGSGTILGFSGDHTLTLGMGESILGDGLFRVSGGSMTIAGDGAFDVASTTISGGDLNFNLTSAASIDELSLSSGNLGGSGDVMVNTAFGWTGGGVVGTGTATVNSDATLTISGTSGKFFRGKIDNAGTTIWQGAGDINSGSGAVFHNQSGAVFDVQNSETMSYNLGGDEVMFLNDGTFQKSADSGDSTFNVVFDSSSLVDVTSGRVDFSRGGNSSGDWVVGNGAVIGFNGSHIIDLEGGQVITGEGAFASLGGTTRVRGSGTYDVTTTMISGGFLHFDMAASTTDFVELSNGALTGSGTLTVNDTCTWTGGNMEGSGVTVIPMGAALNISGSVSKGLRRDISNSGIFTWGGSGHINAGFGALFHNQAGGVFDIQVDQRFSYNVGGGEVTFLNEGTLRKSAGAGTAFFNVIFENAGAAVIESGTLRWERPFQQTAGSLELAGGNVTSVETMAFTGGEVRGSGTISADLDNDGATVRPGSSPGTLSITGDYHQRANGVLEIEVEGTNQGMDFDWLSVSGDVTLDGALTLVRGMSFVPDMGDTFDVVTGGSLTGEFSLVTGTTAGNGLCFNPTYTGTEVILMLIDATPTLHTGAFDAGMGEYAFELSGAPEKMYRIEATEGFGMWREVDTITLPTSKITVVDTLAGDFDYQFYRAIYLP